MSISGSRFEELDKGEAVSRGLAQTGGAAQEGEPQSVSWRIRDLIERATSLKAKGNTDFGQGRWQMALETYREGLAELPPAPLKPASRSLKGKEKAIIDDEQAGQKEEDLAGPAAEQEIRELRAMLSANVAACLLKLVRYEDAVTACDSALEEKPEYAKALHRRALANEAIGSWSSLEASLTDYDKLATLPDISPLLADQIRAAQHRLPDKVRAQEEKEKDEAIGKLKDLGNTLLGKFGLSTDNFKFVEQPGGGHSISFQR
ncbi:TPR domain containing protein [Rhodotorula toruloides]|uniref:TPR domain containing protein n=1 Tax=Rhodotorula toruloides TaxID=5286 RepID=A0A511KEA4_RHOTO|nr:TPR domain containing protein [Rhodotorula toruloides]